MYKAARSFKGRDRKFSVELWKTCRVFGLWQAGLLSAILLLSGTGLAQLSTASLSGAVRDSSGAVVPSAKIVLRNVATAVEHSTTSNGAGAYLFLNITPGTYTVQASAPGFEERRVPEFVLAVGQAAAIDFALSVGSQSTVVTVQGVTPQLETSTASLGTVIGTRQVNDLPLNGRDFTQLLILSAGISPINNGQGGPSGGQYATPEPINQTSTIPSVNGQGNRSNYFFTDGLSNFGSFHSVYAVPPIIDEIQEFKVVSHTDSAEYGSVTGGIVNVVTKSGTNSLHGSVWEYFRHDIFDAQAYFLPPGTPRTPYNQNEFGGTVGGPVWLGKLYNGKNKTFFFGAYQGFRFSQTSNIPRKVPTAAQLAGDESSWPTQIYNPFSTVPDPAHPGQYIRQPFPGNQIPSSLISPQMQAYANFVFPAAGPAFDANGDNVLDTTPETQTINQWTARIDQVIGKNDSAWFRYSYDTSVASASGGLPGIPNVNTNPNRNYGGSYVHVFSPSLVLQGEFGRTVAGANASAFFTKGSADIIQQVGFVPSFAGNYTAIGGSRSLLPQLSINGYSSATENISNHPEVPSSYQFSGVLTKTWGNHEIHTGGGYISNRFLSPIALSNLTYAAQETADTNPLDTVNTGDPVASFLLNAPDSAQRRNINSETRPGGVMSLFVQDNWRVTPKLMINAGLRYDLTFNPPYGTSKQIGQNGGPETGDVDFGNGTYIVQWLPPTCAVRGYAPCIPGSGTLPANVVVSPNKKIIHNTYTNLGPSFGFAYKVTDRTVVRGAFGIVFDNWSGVLQIAQNIAGLWPDIGQQQAVNLNVPKTSSPTPTVTSQDPFASAGNSFFPAPTPFAQVGFMYDPNLKNPYSEQWNFGAQQLLSSSTTLTVNYVGSSSHRLAVGGMYNTALTPGPGDPQSRALFPYIAPTYYDRSVGNGNYNGLQITLDRRYTNGFSYGVAYTWSKSINVGGDGYFGVEGGAPQDPYHPARYDRSVSGLNLKHILAVNTLYDIPVGKGKAFSTKNSVLDYILGNWQINNLFQTHSGIAFTPAISSDIANIGQGFLTTQHLNRVGTTGISHRSAAEWFNTADYAAPPLYTFGNAGRNSILGPAFWNLDMSLFRKFPVGESRRFEFRAEAFNLFNHANLGQPNNDLNSGSAFGTINTTANSARQLQLAGKFIF
ncbi:carboxypeptidase family protein [Edaphobacter aggregans]|uniref:Carboxypeptidase family protein n=1 Tax=Edaphobacter aggregans TaxID=570835 RepID=A0A428MQ54_9BACT|nr:carboxypeptidase-like regulatory domain-containing protein [Edaphobacter aggregans]RSL19005.1 carboxypeptidase family protein [Edaphobacter aggregans]